MMLKTLVLKKTNKKRNIRRIKPVNYKLFKQIIINNVILINENNEENLINKFSVYKNKFIDLNNLKKGYTANHYGFESKSTTLQYYLDRGWNLVESKKLIKIRQNLTSLNSFIKRYGQKDGLKKYEYYINSHKNIFKKNYYDGNHKKFYRPSQIEYWMNKGFNKKDAKDQMFNFYSEKSLKFHKKIKDNGDKFLTVRQLDYWISKGLNIIDAQKQLQRICDTRSLKSLINKYGKESGIKKFNEINKKWLKSFNDKTSEQMLDIRLRQVKNSHRYSKSSKNFFDLILKELKILNIKFTKILYAEKEYWIYDKINKKINFYDFYIKDIKLIIEYNGVLFHPNKTILSESEWKKWQEPYNNLSADEKYKNDQYKKQLAINNGFHFITIWENETFETNFNITINKIKYLYENK